MAQMGFTSATADLRARHTEAGIVMLLHLGFLGRFPETWPAGA